MSIGAAGNGAAAPIKAQTSSSSELKTGLQDQAKHKRALAAHEALKDALEISHQIKGWQKEIKETEGRIEEHSRRSWELWTTRIGPAYVDLHQEAVRRSNRDRGKGYNIAFSKLLKEYNLHDLDHDTRAKLLWLMRHLPEIEKLRGDDTNVNHPTVAWRSWGEQIKDGGAVEDAKPKRKKKTTVRRAKKGKQADDNAGDDEDDDGDDEGSDDDDDDDDEGEGADESEGANGGGIVRR
jgi:hypothetical protein